MIEANYQPLIRVMLPEKSGPGARVVPALSENEIVEGKVLQPASAKTAQLLVKGKKIRVGSRLPFKAGSVILLKVVKTAPQLVLHHLGGPDEKPETRHFGTILAAIKENLWKSVFDRSTQLHLDPADKTKLFKLINIFGKLNINILFNKIN